MTFRNKGNTAKMKLLNHNSENSRVDPSTSLYLNRSNTKVMFYVDLLVNKNKCQLINKHLTCSFQC